MATKTIHVLTAFELNLGGGRIVKVPAGVQVVDAEVADHWYTAAHLAHGGLGTVDYAESAWGNANDAFIKAREAGEHYERLLAASADADEAAGIETRVPPHIAYAETVRMAVAAVADLEGQETAPEVGTERGEAEAEAETNADDEASADADEAEDDRADDVADDQTASPLDHDGKDGAGGSVAATSDKPFDDMTDEELRDFIKLRDGALPHPNTSRPKLLAKARKEPEGE